MLIATAQLRWLKPTHQRDEEEKQEESHFGMQDMRSIRARRRAVFTSRRFSAGARACAANRALARHAVRSDAMLSPIEEEPSLEALHPHAPLRAPRPSSGEPLPLPLLRRPGSLSDLLQRSDDMVESLSGEASSRLPRLTLSEALRGGRGSLTASRLSLVEASVTQLDAPPPGLLPNGQLTSLLLSRNALRSLDGLPASLMRGLTTLSLSYNCLADAEALFAHLGRSCPWKGTRCARWPTRGRWPLPSCPTSARWTDETCCPTNSAQPQPWWLPNTPSSASCWS